MKLFRPPRRKGQKPDPACQSLWLVMALLCIACRTASFLASLSWSRVPSSRVPSAPVVSSSVHSS